MFALQVQPCYLSKLINIVFKSKPAELDKIMIAVNFIFQNINAAQDSTQRRSTKVLAKRDQTLYLNLCKRVIKEEVEKASAFNDLFGITSPTTLILKAFFKSELGSPIPSIMFFKVLKELEQETSKADMFTIDPLDIAKRENIEIGNRSKEILMNDKKVTFLSKIRSKLSL